MSEEGTIAGEWEEAKGREKLREFLMPPGKEVKLQTRPATETLWSR